jgi:hypothetical protein
MNKVKMKKICLLAPLKICMKWPKSSKCLHKSRYHWLICINGKLSSSCFLWCEKFTFWLVHFEIKKMKDRWGDNILITNIQLKAIEELKFIFHRELMQLMHNNCYILLCNITWAMKSLGDDKWWINIKLDPDNGRSGIGFHWRRILLPRWW